MTSMTRWAPRGVLWLGLALGWTACSDDNDADTSGPSGPLFGVAEKALDANEPGVCSNDKSQSCATSADCGGATCYLPTAGGETVHNAVCMGDAAAMKLNCTSNDVGVAATSDLRIVKGCNFPGDTALVSFVAEYALTAQDRYDLGVWIAEDGGDAKTGKCSVSSLPTGPTPPWSNSAKGAQIPDTCGDVTASLSPMYASIQNIDLKCIDSDGDGFAEANVCLSWNQPGANIACNTPTDTHPGSPAKCRCQPLPGIAIPIPGVIKVDKVTDPVGDTTPFSFSLTGGPGNISNTFSLTDIAPSYVSPGLDAGTYVLSETLPANWTKDLATCVSDQGHTPSPDNLVLHNGETVTCTFSNRKLQYPPAFTVSKTNNADHLDGTFSDNETVPGTAVYPWTVPYRLVIANTGSSPMTLASITDDKVPSLLAPLSGGSPECATLIGTVVAGGDSVTCFFEATFYNANLTQVLNTVTITATNLAGTTVLSDSSTVSFVQAPKLGLTKTANIPIYDAVGQVLTYKLVATNEGNVTLTDVSISDPKLGALACTPSQPTTLEPGESVSCAGSHTVTQDDLNAGKYENTANAQGTAPGGVVNAPPASALATAQAVPDLHLTKSVTPTTYEAVGQVLQYTLVATNAGNVTLGNVQITDPKLGTLTCTPALPAVLDPGESVTCTGSHSIVQADLDAGSYSNTATAVGTPPIGPVVEAVAQTVTVTAIQKPALLLTKAGAPPTYDAVGQIITYTIVATNSGNVTLSSVQVSDAKLGALTCTPAQPVTLAPGASISCSGTHTIDQADLDQGWFENTALAKGYAPDLSEVTAPPATEVVEAIAKPALSLKKTPVPTTYTSAGQAITYTFEVTNSGNVTLSGPFVITDDRMGTFQCTAETVLPPLAKLTCSHAYIIVAADVLPTWDGKVINTATASGKHGPNGVTSAPVQATVYQERASGQITPTDTSCSMFAAGTAMTLTTEYYLPKSGVVNSVAPGVFFYYSKIKAPGASFTISVPQVIDGGFRPIDPLDLKQVVLYDQNCIKSPLKGATAYDQVTGLVTVQVSGAAAGQVLYLGIKYQPQSLKGQAVPSPSPTVGYGFETWLDSAMVYSSWAAISVVPKK